MIYGAQLAAIYRKAARRLQVQIAADLKSGEMADADYRARQLAAINGQLAALGRATLPLEYAAAAEAWARGVRVAELAGIDSGATIGFGGANRRAVEQAAIALDGRLAGARETVGRRGADVYRTAGLEETAAGLAQGAAREETSAALTRRLIEDRVTDATTGFVDRAGRRWSLERYTEMVARTTTRELQTAGTFGRMQQAGTDLWTCSSHGSTCEICGPLEGQTFSLGGLTPGYEVNSDGPPWHGNCLHTAMPGTGDMGADLDALEAEFSDRAGVDAAIDRVLGRGLGDVLAADGGILR